MVSAMPRLNGARLTKRVVEAIVVPPGKVETIVHDTSPRGFGVRVKATGTRTYFVKYVVGGRTKRFAIGQHGELTLEQARASAERILGEIRDGADPSAERAAERKAESFEELAERYLDQHAKARLKPAGAADARAALNTYVLPIIGRHKLADVTRADVTRLHHSMRAKPIRANRVLALLSKMLNLAEKWGLRPDGSNPCRHVERYRENKRERYLNAEELKRLGAVLRAAELERTEWPTFVPFLHLLMLTGCRRDEIRTLRWEHVDLEAGLLRLPDSKTGRKDVNLPAAARQILAAMPRKEGNPFVIWGAVEGKPLIDAKRSWKRIRESAKLEGVRLHDLRHTHASYAVSGGLPLPIVGALLGHTQPQTTQRYAHLHRDPLRDASEKVGAVIAAALDPEGHAHADVVKIGTARRKG